MDQVKSGSAVKLVNFGPLDLKGTPTESHMSDQ